MSLHGYKGALALAGLGFDDVQLVEVPLLDQAAARPGGGLAAPLVRARTPGPWRAGRRLREGRRRCRRRPPPGPGGGVDLDLVDPRHRVNNGTPRPITVHQNLLDDHFDLVVRFLAQTLRAAEWAAENRDDLHAILEVETRAGREGVAEAYRGDFHTTLAPDLSAQRLEFLGVQKTFLNLHGFLERDFDIADWVDARPLQAAHDLLAQRRA